MNLGAGALPFPWLAATWLLLIPLLAGLILRAPWTRLREPGRRHAFLGATVSLMLLWGLRTDLPPHLHLHYLGIATVALMFGWRLAAVAAAAALVGISLNGEAGWSAFAANLLLMGVLPAWVTCAVRRLAERRLAPNLFVYLYVCGAFGAALSMAACLLAGAALLGAGATGAFAQVLGTYLVAAPFLIVTEGVLNGMVITGLVIYRPEWVTTFDRNRYLPPQS